MVRICCYCQKIMGEKEPLENKSITHGICPDCNRKLEEQEKLNENQPPQKKGTYTAPPP